MCGRYSLATPDPDALRARFPIGESLAIRRRYNIAPTDEVLAVLGGDREPEGALLRWGLVPHWASPSIGARLINARSETLERTPAFRDAFRRHRCLIIADGFYEWKVTERGKRPYWVTRADGAPFAFAGLWAVWHDPAGAPLRTCSIVTTRPNAVLAPLHDRMPVMLDRADEAVWLATDSAPATLRACLHPPPDALVAARPVSRAVSDVRNDGPECLAPPEPEPERPVAPRLF